MQCSRQLLPEELDVIANKSGCNNLAGIGGHRL